MHTAPSGQTQQNAAQQREKPLRLEAAPWVRAGLGRSSTYALMAANQFPRPVKLGRSSRWISAEVDQWIADRVAERDAVAGRG